MKIKNTLLHQNEGKTQKSAFTLVELVVVLTIFAVLSTISFFSFQNFTKSSRDANRVTTIKNIEKWLVLYKLKSLKYPEPENKVQILSGSVVLIQQWVVGENMPYIINLNKEVYDPKDDTNYLYVTNRNKKRYQLWIYLEENDLVSYIWKTYANNIDYTNRYLYTVWDLVGIIADENNFPISLENYPTGKVDVTDTENENKNFILSFSNNQNDKNITSSWIKVPEIINSYQQISKTSIPKNCGTIPNNQTKLFWNIPSVTPWGNCPWWVEFTCVNWEWIHETLDKVNYPYSSCLEWNNVCNLTDWWWWIILSESNPSCYLWN